MAPPRRPLEPREPTPPPRRGTPNQTIIDANTGPDNWSSDSPWSSFGDDYAGMTGSDWTNLFGGDKQGYIDSFLGPNMLDPTFKKLIAKYGPKFQKYAYEMWRDGKTPTKNELEYLFPGAGKLLGGGGGGGGGGGRRAQDLEDIVRNEMATLGYTEADIAAQVKDIALRADAEDWSPEKLTQYLLRDPSRLTNAGSYTEMASRVKDMSLAQLVPIDDNQAQGWSRRILSGELDLMTVQNILATNAANEFGWAADALSQGATMRDILSPTVSTIARELEINTQDVNLMDTKWRSMVQTANTDGTMRAATMTEAVRAARKDERYASTSGGARNAAETATMLRAVFEG